MLDSNALQQLVEQQVKKEVADKIQQTMSEEWLKTVEADAIKFIQDRVVAKFANSEAMPELIDAVKSSVKDLFHSGKIPGLAQYIDYGFITRSINDSTQDLIKQAISELTLDPVWLEKIETVVNQHAIQRVLASLSSTDIRPIIKQSIEETVNNLNTSVFKGIQSNSESVELTVLDDHVVVENNFTAKDISAINSLTVKDLVVKGSINTDNYAWQELANNVGTKAFEKLDAKWKESLVKQVKEAITDQGIDFDKVKISGELLVDSGKLAGTITESNLQSVGTLAKLTVTGETTLNETMSVTKRRVGINTADPDMALSIWDEEVTISAGKFKNQTGFIGTTRKQALSIGVNKTPAIEISDVGVTSIKQLQVGIHKVSHGIEVPNYSGTKGDIVFNANPTVENPVFAWQCLGGFKWKLIKAVE
jgi:hypothetical protein